MTRDTARGVLAAMTAALAVSLGAAPAATGPPAPSSPPETEGAQATVRPFSPVEVRHEPSADDRYTLAGGCFTLTPVETGVPLVHDGDGFAAPTEPSGDPARDPAAFHFEPTDLGRYLLFTEDAAFLAASEGLLAEATAGPRDNSAAALADGASQGTLGHALTALERSPANRLAGRGAAVVAAPEPSDLADWGISETEDGFRLVLPVLDAALAVDEDGIVGLAGTTEAGTTFIPEKTAGCAPWPEVEINIEGPPARGDSPTDEVRGYLDTHAHLMGFERVGGRARCGRPWHHFGVAWALRGCPEHEDTGGRTHVLTTVISGRDPVAGHDPRGWPTFRDWPAHDALLYEQVYHRWLERAWRGGLRLIVNLMAENEQLCTAYPFREHGCNEMDAVRRQIERTRELERYIDAHWGGPGRGWFRVVTDPFEARHVINEGRLAIVLGIEVSRLFDCRLVGDFPTCDEGDIDTGLAEAHNLGVRNLLMTNWYDNALTGVKGHGGTQGVAVNLGNFAETGQFWRMERCPSDARGHDTTLLNPGDQAGGPARDALAEILGRTAPLGAAPLYPPGPHCNTLGLSDLGAHLLARIIERGMIFDPDHMSARARHAALDILEDAGYGGVVSSHSWADEEVERRVLALGGIVTPSSRGASSFVGAWQRLRAWADDRFLFGFGVGSDIHGFATQGGPRGAGAPNPVTYPFEGFGGVIVDRQVSGERTFDINTDGVAHYGLYPDWFEDLRRIADPEMVDSLEHGPEAFLQMWERAVGAAPA